MRDIVWRPRVVADLDGIVTYIILELRSASAAQSCGEAILGSIERIAELPESGRPLFDEDLERPYRRALAKNYWIYYSFDNETLTIWRIFHVTQDHDGYGFEMLGG